MELMKLNIQKFASSGTLGTLSGSYKTTYTVTWSLLSQSTSNNTSTIRLTATLYTGNNTTISSSYSTFKLDETTVYSGAYSKSGAGNVFVKTKDITITHNSNGSFPNRTVSFSTNDYVMGNQSGSGTISGVPSIARYPVLTSGQNFTDEENPTLTFTNPAKIYPIRVKLEAGGNNKLITRDIGTTATSYTFDLTEEERNKLRELATTNSLSVVQTVCAMNGETELSSSYKTYTMTIVNGNPIFNDFVYEDINEQTFTLTGDNQSVIAGYSDVKVTIPVTNKAVAQKQATMSKYRFNSIDVNYSDTNDVSIVSNKVPNGDFTVYAIDSRGNSKPVTKNATNVINYTPLQKGNITSNRQNGVSENTILKFDGKFWNDYFGSNLRNIEVGDDLSGKTIYCQFPETLGEELVLDDYVRVNSIQFVSCYDASIGELTGYLKSGMETRESGLDYQYVKVEDEDIFNNDPTKEQIINYSSYQLSDTFGVVTEIDTTSSAYKYIFIEDDSRKNSIISSKYRFKIAGASDDDWSDEFDLILNTDDKGNFNFEELIKGDTETLGFNISNAYNIEVIIEDKLSKITYTTNLGSGTPHIAYAKNGVGIMGKYDESVGGLLQIAGKNISEMTGQMMRVYRSSSQTITPNTTTLINLDTIGNNAEGLTLKDGKIIIGKNIHTILANGRWTSWGTSYSKYVYIFKNGVTEAFHMAPTNTVETNVILPVKEGDEISLHCYQENSSNIDTASNYAQTFLQVVVIN